MDNGYIFISDLLKARPSEEGSDRFIYLEASNETVDQQGEKVLAKALSNSADHFLRYGNIDIDHMTLVGPQRGMKDYHLFQVGLPVEVKLDGPRTFVKAQLHTGDSPLAKLANDVWDGMTKVSPPIRYYPSVGGSIQERGVEITEDGGKLNLVKAVTWTNIGLSQTPVNQSVPTATAVPFGIFAKSWAAHNGLLFKMLSDDQSVDLQSMKQGAALRDGGKPILECLSGFYLRNPSATKSDAISYLVNMGYDDDDARMIVAGFLSTLASHLV